MNWKEKHVLIYNIDIKIHHPESEKTFTRVIVSTKLSTPTNRYYHRKMTGLPNEFSGNWRCRSSIHVFLWCHEYRLIEIQVRARRRSHIPTTNVNDVLFVMRVLVRFSVIAVFGFSELRLYLSRHKFFLSVCCKVRPQIPARLLLWRCATIWYGPLMTRPTCCSRTTTLSSSRTRSLSPYTIIWCCLKKTSRTCAASSNITYPSWFTCKSRDWIM